MSCIIAVAEFMWNARKIINDPEVKDAMDAIKHESVAVPCFQAK